MLPKHCHFAASALINGSVKPFVGATALFPLEKVIVYSNDIWLNKAVCFNLYYLDYTENLLFSEFIFSKCFQCIVDAVDWTYKVLPYYYRTFLSICQANFSILVAGAIPIFCKTVLRG